jgi:putative acetyltransferase
MIEILRTNSENKDFIDLVKLLDKYLSEMDGDEHQFYAQFNTIDKIKHVVVAYINEEPVGCGAIKELNASSMEIKRMYTSPAYRNNGIASAILLELEKWTSELGYKKCVLETGIRQTEAIALYKKNNYISIENYGQYKNVENSRCFEKVLTQNH